ncbi:hypothetical protein Pan153_30280 [Gimesia panareensis]|uniref:Tetratricopeptide repeat protein n=1 Tax=Gimesia panareensis TaxID=2527978 RepID=A0A518FPT9_9PLAN|nr:hypothetical protein [Gimesia panareensis]QDV18371.1 hypothetical protein Pan153_30280 [Gimesia panareensis]
MPDYYYTATDRITRQRETNFIAADSAQEALRELEAAELEEIVLHTDDVSAAISNMMPRKVSVKDDFTAAEYVSFRTMGNLGFFIYLTKKLYWQMRWSLLIGTLLSVSIFCTANDLERSYGIVSLSIFLFFILLPPGISLFTTLFSPSRKFNQIQEDFYWGRWNEVLKLLPKVRKHLPLIEARGREAASLAGLGRLDEALKTMEPLAENSEIPRWMYLSRLAEVYECNNQMEQCFELRRQASEMAPDNSALKLGYANTLLKLNRNPQLAHQLIKDAESKQLSDLLQILVPLSKGHLELNLGHARLAFYLFVQAQNGLKPYLATQPFARLYSDIGRAYAAIALAEMGETEEAETLFQSALPRLEALKSQRTIERYRQAISR